MIPRLHPETRRLIDHYGMQEHPEGGWFVELFRSDRTVHPDDDRPARSALTTILFLLDREHHHGISALHRVRSDEVWHHLGGDPLELVLLDGGFEDLHRIELDAERPVHVVPADWWQAARTSGAYTFVGCTVGPGFDFEDFTLLRTDPTQAKHFRERHADLSDLV